MNILIAVCMTGILVSYSVGQQPKCDSDSECATGSKCKIACGCKTSPLQKYCTKPQGETDKCGIPIITSPYVILGEYNGTTSIGATISYACADGYIIPFGHPDYIQCLDGTWTDAICEADSGITCPPPTFTTPQVIFSETQDDYPVGHQLYYTCDPCAFFHDKEDYITCQSNGNWTAASCVFGPDVGYLKNGESIPYDAKGCKSVSDTYCFTGSVAGGLQLYGVEDYCYCDSLCCSFGDCCYDSMCGYIDPPVTYVCLHPTFTYPQVVFYEEMVGYDVGHELYYECEPCAFYNDQAPFITCQENGQWTEASCVFGPDVGYLPNGEPIPEDAKGCKSEYNVGWYGVYCADYVSDGFMLSGYYSSCYCDSACCSYGDCCFDSMCGYKGETPTIPPITIVCPHPTFTSPQVIFAVEMDGYEAGYNLYYKCDPCAFFHDQMEYITCQENGQWTEASCVYGPDVGYLQNGEVIPVDAPGCKSEFYTGSYDGYCAGYVTDGFMLIGDYGDCYCDSVCCSFGDCCYDSLCGYNGEIPPITIVCPHPTFTSPQVVFAVEMDEYEAGYNLYYECDPCAFFHDQLNYITCQGNGQWTEASCVYGPNVGYVPNGEPIPSNAKGCVTAYNIGSIFNGKDLCAGYVSNGFLLSGYYDNGCYCDSECCSFGDCCFDSLCGYDGEMPQPVCSHPVHTSLQWAFPEILAGYPVGYKLYYICIPCAFIPAKPNYITCLGNEQWTQPSCVHAPELGHVPNGMPIPDDAIGCKKTYDVGDPGISYCAGNVSNGFLLSGKYGVCYCDSLCCKLGNCCFDSLCGLITPG